MLVCFDCEYDLLKSPQISLFFTEYDTHQTRANLLNTTNITKHLLTPSYSSLIVLGRYKWPLDKLILDLKFSQGVYCADILTNWFSKRIHPHCLGAVQALIPIPLSNIRYIQRQYNQSQLIAELLGKHYGIPVYNALKRNRHTRAQAKLNFEQRYENLVDAFVCNQHLSYQHIAIVDDVITTGATINQACFAMLAKHPDLQITVITMAISLDEPHD